MEVTKYPSSDGNVLKYVFTKKDAVYEAVLYKYGSYRERTVLCVSVQCGCRVGCTFCGTGKKFVRNLSESEIIDQVLHIFDEVEQSDDIKWDLGTECEKLQIMFMSMGEPFHNYFAVKGALKKLTDMYPTADLLLSTVAPLEEHALRDFLVLSTGIPQIGLQFSVHQSTDKERTKLIPYSKKLSLVDLRDYGVAWFIETGRNPYINYCVSGSNCSEEDYLNLRTLFPPNIFNFTFSVVCSADETMKDCGFRNLEVIQKFQARFIDAGYSTRLFNPDGQDDIGGGCGQLWYVQSWLKSRQS